MKKKLFFTLALLWCTLLSFGQTFTDNGITYAVTSSISPLTVKVSDNGYITGVVNIAATVRYNNNFYSVTSIDAFAFISCIGLTSVTMPNSVTRIGYAAFSGCTGLTSITFSNSLASIEQSAFNNCTSLTSVIIPNSLTTLGAGAFYNCSGLTSINIPNSVISIGDSAFNNCAGLTSVILPTAITNISAGLFYNCSGLTSITIPNSVTVLGIYAFYGCIGLTSVTIPNLVTGIGESAFESCTGLTSVTIPNSVTNIGDNAFKNCTGLTSVIVNRATPLTINANVFQGVTLGNVALNVPAGTVASYAIAAVWSGFSPILPQCTTSTTWNGSGWSNGAPTSSTAAIFTGNYTATTDLTACSVSVLNNAIVTIPSGFDFTVINGVSVASTATLTFDNNANLIQTNVATNTGNVVLKRNTSMQRLAYTFWSSPVANQNALAFSPLTVPTRFYTYNEGTNAFAELSTPSTTNLIPTVGYGIRAPNTFADAPLLSTPFVGTFEGIPNNGNYNYSATKTLNGYNLIGNPYPSTMLASAFLAANPLVNALYFWDNANLGNVGNRYATLSSGGSVASGISITKSPTNVIAVGQGFYVQVSSATNIVFNNTMRSSSNAPVFFRNATTNKSLFKLNLANANTTFNQIAIGYMNNATNGVDNQIDAIPFAQSNTMVSSLINNVDYVIQGRALPFDASDVVPLGFKTDVSGSYSFSATAFEGVFNDNQNIFVKDNLTGTMHNIKQSPYNFTSNIGTFNARFEIVYQSNLSIQNPNFNENTVFVFKKDGGIEVNSGNTVIKNVMVYDIQGRKISEKLNVNVTKIQLDLNTAQQVLLVKITNVNNEIITKKIIY